jgi:hypothetical protein
MDYRTFNQWSSAGYKIIKGSKAKWVDGVPMFSERQVHKYVRPTYNKYCYDSYDEYEDEMRYDPWMGGYY